MFTLCVCLINVGPIRIVGVKKTDVYVLDDPVVCSDVSVLRIKEAEKALKVKRRSEKKRATQQSKQQFI